MAALLVIPGWILTLAAGAVYGLLLGTVIVSIASTTAAALAFLIARYVARDAVRRHVEQSPKLAAVDGAIGEQGWRIVALLRLSPAVPFNLQNICTESLQSASGRASWLAGWRCCRERSCMFIGSLRRTAATGETSTAQWMMRGIGLVATVAVTIYLARLATGLAIPGAVAAPATAAEPQRSSAGDVLQRLRRQTFHPLEDGFTKDAELKRHGIADLDDQDWLVRTLAIRDLARMGSPAIPALLASLNDDNLHVRQVSALVLGILPLEEPFAQSLGPRRRGLEERLTEDLDPVVRSEAAIGLGRIGDSDSVAVLKRAAEADSSRDIRHQCTLAIDRIGKADSDNSIFEAYRAMNESTFNTVAVGQAAADFTLLDTDALPWRLSELRGKKTVVLI